MKKASSLFGLMDPEGYPGHRNVFSTDYEAVTAIVLIHSPVANPIILDVTFADGKMWKGNNMFEPDIKTDKRDLPRLDHVMDFRDMEPIKDDSIDVIVFDPPHIAKHAATGTINYQESYGVEDGLTTDDLTGGVQEFFYPFLLEAHRVLRHKGIVLCKIIDLVHDGQPVFQHLDFVVYAHLAGFRVKEIAIKLTGNLPKAPNWKVQRHLRNGFSFWLCVQKMKPRRHPVVYYQNDLLPYPYA